MSGIACAAALGGFLVGFDATVISGTVPFIREYFQLDGDGGSLRLGWAVSSLGWGAMAGNLMAGLLSDLLGRRRLLLLTSLLFLVSSVAASLATGFVLFVGARIFAGIGVGAALLTAPVYIAEISPAGRRGGLVSLNQLMIVIGISVSFFSNYFLLPTGADNWRWMLGVQAVPAAIYIALLLMIPESPRWLLQRGRRDEALSVLRRVQGESAAGAEFDRLRGSIEHSVRRFEWSRLLQPRLRRMMLFGMGIAFFQQATGINAIFYYLPSIFAQAGGGLATAFGQSVMVGIVNVGFTLVAIRLIDRVGRRPLLALGVTGMAAALLTISWAFSTAASDGGATGHGTLVLVAIMAYVASFAVSLGPVMWVLLSEIFPNEERAAAIAAVGFWNSLVSATVTLIFPAELQRLGAAGTFLCFGLIAAAALVFVLMLAPETKGKTLEELESLLAGRRRALSN